MRDQTTTVPQALRHFFEAHHRIALAFSGGVDSAYLLYAATACGADVRAYFVKTQFQPEFEREDAHRLAEQLGARLTILPYDVLGHAEVAQNPADRCYHCKRALFTQLSGAARGDGYAVVMDGTNASDDAGDRPGMRALSELSVFSPLRLCGVTKAEVRAHSRKAGLFTWDKPAYACLATRIPTGHPIDAELLLRVERAEGALFGLGFSDFRVRITHGAAKLQLREAQLAKAFAMRGEITAALAGDFPEVLLDLRARGGE